MPGPIVLQGPALWDSSPQFPSAATGLHQTCLRSGVFPPARLGISDPAKVPIAGRIQDRKPRTKRRERSAKNASGERRNACATQKKTRILALQTPSHSRAFTFQEQAQAEPDRTFHELVHSAGAHISPFTRFSGIIAQITQDYPLLSDGSHAAAPSNLALLTAQGCFHTMKHS